MSRDQKVAAEPFERRPIYLGGDSVLARKIRKVVTRPFRDVQWTAIHSATHEYALGMFMAFLASNRIPIVFEQELLPPCRQLTRDTLAGEAVFWSESESDRYLLALTVPDDQAVALVTQELVGVTTIRVGAHEEEAARRALAYIRDALVDPDAAVPSGLRMVFWHLGRFGPSRAVREHDHVAWGSISANYPAVTRGHLANLMENFRPIEGAGGLIVFHGVPGGGKTWATQALATAWQSWCRFEYMVDPESFLGHPQYMTSVLLNQPPGIEVGEDYPGGRWRLLVLEDTGELLSIDAKREHGQAISRLLNICDGILGQGLKTMLLVTTNEELGRLSPAVIRHGRCAAMVEFNSFGPQEARDWLIERGCKEPIAGRAVPLSDLYAMLRGQARVVDERKKVGFALS